MLSFSSRHCFIVLVVLEVSYIDLLFFLWYLFLSHDKQPYHWCDYDSYYWWHYDTVTTLVCGLNCILNNKLVEFYWSRNNITIVKCHLIIVLKVSLLTLLDVG